MGDAHITHTTGPPPRVGGSKETRVNELAPAFTRQALHPAMHEKLLLRAAEVVEVGWPSVGRP